MSETVTIPIAEYNRLLDASAKVEKLQKTIDLLRTNLSDALAKLDAVLDQKQKS